VRTLLLTVFATVLLAIAFFAFFPEMALTMLADGGGPRTVSLVMDDKATDIRWIIGVVSFCAAVGTYVRAFT